MSHALSHRGPDGSGLADVASHDGSVQGAFGHRRLAIIDLSESGSQPMFTADGRFAITFNGLIYNYAELKAELEREGMRFHGTCDTEVLLLGWERHGADFLPRLRGMFAFAIWDRQSGTCHLVRDPFGIKPLYIFEGNGEVLFASEVRAILASGKVPPVFSSAAVASYLFTGSVAEPLTIIEGIVAIPPGCVVEIHHDKAGFRALEPRRFRTAVPEDEELDLPPSCHVHRVRNALRDSVRYHLVSDVPVGLFLSGGIDSSAVAGLATEVSEKRLESFTVTFAESDYSEAQPAREAAQRFNTHHHEIPLSGQDLLGALDDVFSAMDQPSLDGLNTFVVSRAVRSHGLKVVLSGLGGDELFGGYPSFRRARVLSSFWRMPAAVRGAVAVGSGPLGDLRAERMRNVLREKTPAFAAYRASRTLFSENQLATLTGSRYPGGMGMERSPDETDVSGLGLMQQVAMHELSGYMRNTLLRDSDVFSMAHALELRVPMVDLHVASAAFAAAGSMQKMRGGIKPILVEAVRDLLPPATIDRPKRGFTLPFETWMRTEMFSEVDAILSGPLANSMGLKSAPVREIWSQFQKRRAGVNWSRPWALYTLIRWGIQNGVTAGLENLTSAETEENFAAVG